MMGAKEQRPAMTGHERGDIILTRHDKDNISLSNRQRKVYNLPCSGGKFSSTNITIRLG